MNILISGGGTAGHINPAIAIAKILEKNIKSVKIYFVGTPNGLENRIVGAEGYEIFHINVRGLQRRITVKNLGTAMLAVSSVFKAKRLLRKLKPALVIGTGGYVCFPLIYAASKMKIPTVIHESNAYPGLATRILSKKASITLLGFSAAEAKLKKAKKVITVGNPIRNGFSFTDKSTAREKLKIRKNTKVILSFGGSLGSAEINSTILALIREKISKNPDIFIFHVCGGGNFDNCKREFDEISLPYSNAMIFPYLDNIYDYMAACDIVICRSGAMTLTETAIMKKAVILIPSPNVTDNHQYKNAKALEIEGACILIEEKQLTASFLNEKISRILNDNNYRASLESSIEKFASKNVNKLIFREISELIDIKK